MKIFIQISIMTEKNVINITTLQFTFPHFQAPSVSCFYPKKFVLRLKGKHFPYDSRATKEIESVFSFPTLPCENSRIHKTERVRGSKRGFSDDRENLGKLTHKTSADEIIFFSVSCCCEKEKLINSFVG